MHACVCVCVCVRVCVPIPMYVHVYICLYLCKVYAYTMLVCVCVCVWVPVYVVTVLYMHTMQTLQSSIQDEEVVQLPPDPGSGSVDLIDFSNPADLLLELVKPCGGSAIISKLTKVGGHSPLQYESGHLYHISKPQ